MVLTKTLLGNKLRRLRQERQLTQKQMAEQLGISASYLNLIEHDERPVTVALLLKLGQAFGVDLQELSDDPERRLAAALREVFADAGLKAADIDADEVRRLVASAPTAARAMVDLYRAWRMAREDAQALQIDLPSGRKQRVVLPTEEARDFFEGHANYFAEIEAAAEALSADPALKQGEFARGLSERLAACHGIAVEIAPLEQMAGALRRYDPAAHRLSLSEALPRASRHFHMAYQLGLIEAKTAIDGIIRAAKLSSPESETLCRVGLANYFAGAMLMPYAAFLGEARAARYDVELLMHRFDVSFEQVAHRLSTLQKPGDAGVPFFFLRADIAGNISKRFSAAGFHFSRFGGSCARFIVHEAFATPGLIRRQIARLPDGATFFAIARTLDHQAGSFHAPVSHLAVGLGCDIARAAELVYADGLDLAHGEAATEIGIGCRLCERSDCRQRAFPPLQHRLVVDETVKGPSAYAFKERR
jgi:predicted transcriptional regulator/transcriptional regulator with XRE-family HTH domain